MNAAPGQQHFNPVNPDSFGRRSLSVKASRLALSLSLVLTVASFGLAAPGFGQSLPHTTQPPTAQVQRVRQSLPSLPLQFPLGEWLARGLIWTLYLGIPIALIVMTHHRELEERERLAKLVEHMATLERIWQHSPTR